MNHLYMWTLVVALESCCNTQSPFIITPCLCNVFPLQAKVDNEILDYRDLAAIPKVKAIYDIERPDLINYEPLYTTSLDEMEERESVGEVK